MEIAPTMIGLLVSCFVLMNASPVQENGEVVSLQLIRHQSDHRVRRDAEESSMPDVLVMQFPLGGETVMLRLQRARFPPMYMVGKDGLREITGIDDESSSVYADPSRGASFMVKKSTDGQFLLDGNFRHQRSQMEMKPVTRKKRSADDDNSHTVINTIPEVIEFEHDFDGQGPTVQQEGDVASKRRKRQVPITMHTVETAFVVDHTDYAAWQTRFPDNTLNEIRMFYTQIELTLNNIYASVNAEDPALDIKVPITALYVVESEDNAVTVEADGELEGRTYLDAFIAWIPGQVQAGLPSSDHYMAFTAYNITFFGFEAVGVAQSAQVCTERSTSVVENSFKARVANIAAHELGHTLSADHDGTGTGNTCPSNLQNVMTPGLFVPTRDPATPRNIFEFSECSVAAFKTYLAGVTCTSPAETSASVELPFTGFNYELITNRDRQCQVAINDTRSFRCTFQTEEQLCIGMLCDLPDDPDNFCRFVLPFEGTSCGTGRICSRGLCEDAATVTQASATFDGPTTEATTTPETTTTTPETTTTTPETTTTTPETTTTTPETTTTTPETTTTTPETTTPETTTTTPETTSTTPETTTTTPETTTTTPETTTTTPETTTTTPETTTTTPETTTTTSETTTTTPETTTTTPETTTTTPETTTTTPDTTTTTPETTTTTPETTTTTPETTTTTPETTTTTPETTTTTPETTTTTPETTTTTPETTTTTPETTTTTPETTTPETTTTTPETTSTTPETTTTTPETTTTTPETTTTTPETTTTTPETTTTTPETTTTTSETTTTTPETTTTTPETTTTTPETTTTTPDTTTTTPETPTTTPETTTTTPETTTTTPDTATPTPETTTTSPETTTTTPETTTTTPDTTTTTPETTTSTPETTTTTPETTTTTPETTTTTPETTTTTPETTTTTPETTTTTPETTTTMPESTTTTPEMTTTTPETTTTTPETTSTTPETTNTTPETTTTPESTTETSTTPASTTGTTTKPLPPTCTSCDRYTYYVCFRKYLYSFYLRRPLSPCCKACLRFRRTRRRRQRRRYYY